MVRNNTVTISFTASHSPTVLTLVCHRYNLMDELARLSRWGCKVVGISAR